MTKPSSWFVLITFGIWIVLVLPFPPSIAGAPPDWSPLDSSWKSVLHHAFAHGWQLGRDIVFTFGPWGFCYGATYDPHTYVASFLCHLFLVSVLFAGVHAVYRTLQACPFVIAILMVLMAGLLGSYRAREIAELEILYLAVPILTLVVHFKVEHASPWTRGLIVAHLVALGLVGLVKFSFLMLGTVVVGLMAVDQVRRKRLPWVILVYVVSLLGFWLLAGQSLANLAEYLRTSWLLAGGYDVMALRDPVGEILLFLTAVGALWATMVFTEWRSDRITSVLFSLGFSLTFLLLFKAGFVRHDPMHLILPVYGVSFLGLLYLPLAWKSVGITRLLVVAAGVLCLAFSLYARVPQKWARIPADVCNKVAHGVREAPRLSQKFENRQAEIRNAYPLPRIEGTVDVYPYLQGVLFAHGLRYSPRPIFQSYSAYVPALADLNARHLVGTNAPDSILFDVSPIDHRYSSMEDGASWPLLLTRYEISPKTSESPELLILRRRARPASFELQSISSVKGRFDASIEVPESGDDPVWVTIRFEQSGKGKLRALLFKSSPLYMDVVTRDGHSFHHRLMPAIAGAGFLLSPRIETREDFARLYSSREYADLEGARVTRFTITGDGVSEYHPQFRVDFFRLLYPRTE